MHRTISPGIGSCWVRGDVCDDGLLLTVVHQTQKKRTVCSLPNQCCWSSQQPATAAVVVLEGRDIYLVDTMIHQLIVYAYVDHTIHYNIHWSVRYGTVGNPCSLHRWPCFRRLPSKYCTVPGSLFFPFHYYLRPFFFSLPPSHNRSAVTHQALFPPRHQYGSCFAFLSR